MWTTIRYGERDVELDVEVGFANVSRERREWFHDGCSLRIFYEGRELHAPKLEQELIRDFGDFWFRRWIQGSY